MVLIKLSISNDSDGGGLIILRSFRPFLATSISCILYEGSLNTA